MGSNRRAYLCLVQKQNRNLEQNTAVGETGAHSNSARRTLLGYLHYAFLNHKSGPWKDGSACSLLSVRAFNYEAMRAGALLMWARQQGAFLCDTRAQECSRAQEQDGAGAGRRRPAHTPH